MKNIYLHEVRVHLKALAFWSLGLCALIFGGMAKYIGFAPASGADLSLFLDKFPRIFLAVFGMGGVDIDIQSLGGFYSILENYALICAGVYAVHLGTNAVSREMADKTYEFLFTRPRTRSEILTVKLLGGVTMLILFCALNAAFSYLAVYAYGFENTIGAQIWLYSAACFVSGLVFLAFAAAVSALLPKAEQGMRAGNAGFIAAYLLYVVCNMLEKPDPLRYLTPLKYFTGERILAGGLDAPYLIFAVFASAALFLTAYIAFRKRDLSAI